MPKHYYIGVDGGATKSIVRIEDESGKLLGREIGGPANIRLSVLDTWQSIQTSILHLLKSLNLSLDSSDFFHIGMGLAGCEILSAYQAFITTPHAYTTLAVTSDSHIACLGAHEGIDGAIIILGTGVVGFQIEKGLTSKIGGWGFPHDDEGGGAWLGLEATRLTLKWQDKRSPASGLAKAIYEHFHQDLDQLVNFANSANSTAFAQLAPLVIKQAELKDPSALALLKAASQELDQISAALLASQTQTPALPCALIGGLAPLLTPYLSNSLSERLVPAKKTPDEGAILFLRDYLNKREELYA